MPTTTELILNYATLKGNTFNRKELLEFIKKDETNKNVGTIDLQLNRLVKSEELKKNRVWKI